MFWNPHSFPQLLHETVIQRSTQIFPGSPYSENNNFSVHPTSYSLLHSPDSIDHKLGAESWFSKRHTEYAPYLTTAGRQNIQVNPQLLASKHSNDEISQRPGRWCSKFLLLRLAIGTPWKKLALVSEVYNEGNIDWNRWAFCWEWFSNNNNKKVIGREPASGESEKAILQNYF